MHHGTQVKVHSGNGSDVEGVDSAESDGVDEPRSRQIRTGMGSGVTGIGSGFGGGSAAGRSTRRTRSSIADQNWYGDPAGRRKRVVRMVRMVRMLDVFRIFVLVARPFRLVAMVLEPDFHLELHFRLYREHPK